MPASWSLRVPRMAMRSLPALSVCSRCVSSAAAAVSAPYPATTTMLISSPSSSARPSAISGISVPIAPAPSGPPRASAAAGVTVVGAASALAAATAPARTSELSWFTSRASAAAVAASNASRTRPSCSTRRAGPPSAPGVSVAWMLLAQVPGEVAVSVKRLVAPAATCQVIDRISTSAARLATRTA